MSIEISVNGELCQIEKGLSLADYLTQLGYENKKIAVELNEEILPMRLHAETSIQDQDKIEIVEAIGGG